MGVVRVAFAFLLSVTKLPMNDSTCPPRRSQPGPKFGGTVDASTVTDVLVVELVITVTLPPRTGTFAMASTTAVMPVPVTRPNAA